MNQIIEPKILKGFRDFLPHQEMARKKILATLEQVCRNFGYSPIDTPVLEYSEVLLGKGGGETDKQVYNFTDHGGRKVAMRFDLTVPFARFMAAHSSTLTLPFKRYHFAKVYRGENTQRGRYREFMQCDFDSVGVDSPSADFEILLLMYNAFQAIGIPEITIHLSHRGIFNRYLQLRNIEEKSVEILRTVDKIKKIGTDETLKILQTLCPEKIAKEILHFIEAGSNHLTTTTTERFKMNLQTLNIIETLAGGPSEDSHRIRDILTWAENLGISDSFFLDPSITRGLDYYTGIVYETYLNKLPEIGSVCSGGRYNNLASLYTKEELPGVGSSIGLDRLIAAMEELGTLGEPEANVDVLVFQMDPDLTGWYHRLAQTLRENAISAEVYPLAKKITAQFSYAEKNLIPWGIIAGSREAESNTFQLKNLLTRDSHDGLTMEKLISRIKGK